jgi:hypothetical protein
MAAFGRQGLDCLGDSRVIIRMSYRFARSFTAFAFAGFAALALSGCVGGTTYGTGVSQEEQTLKDVYTMFNLKPESKKIDYSPRPDLIVPENRQALVEPIDSAATASNVAWPETPEERIARIQAAAGEVDPRTGEVSVEERLRKKEGIGIEQGYITRKFTPGQTDRDGNPLLGPPDEGARQQVLQAKEATTISRGTTRRYLTEPPVAYRQPIDSAPAGVDAYSDEEKARMDEEERKLRLQRMQELGGRG